MDIKIENKLNTDKKAMRDIGRALAWGFLDVLFFCFAIGYCIAFIITPVDDCDRSRWDRCEMRVLTDNKTGIQYLVTSGGGIIERATNDQ